MASKCRWNVFIFNPKWTGAANAWFHDEEDETAPRLSYYCARNFACLVGQDSTSLDRIPPCLPVRFFYVKKWWKVDIFVYHLTTAKTWFTAKLTWKVLVLIFLTWWKLWSGIMYLSHEGRKLRRMIYGWSLHKAMRAVLLSLRSFLGFCETS